MADIQADDFIQWRNGNAEYLSAKTLNEYLTRMITLLNWMEKVGRIPKNPMRHIQRVDGRGRLKRERGAFAVDELERLIDVAFSNSLVHFLAAIRVCVVVRLNSSLGKCAFG